MTYDKQILTASELYEILTHDKCIVRSVNFFSINAYLSILSEKVSTRKIRCFIVGNVMIAEELNPNRKHTNTPSLF